MTQGSLSRTTIDILIIEDDNAVDNALHSAFGGSYTDIDLNYRFLRSESLVQACEVIERNKPDIILASLVSLTSDVRTAIEKIRLADESVPIIAICNKEAERAALEAVKCGVQDCLFIEALDRSRMVQAIHYAIERRRIVSATSRIHAQQLEVTIDALNDGVLITDCHRKILFANKAACGLLRKSAENVLGQLVEIPFTPGSLVPHIMEFDQEKFHIEVMSTVVPLAPGEAGFCVTLRNVTENKRMQDEISKAAKLKDEFIAHMSHELRTPMNGIMGMTSLLEEAQLPQVLQGFVSTIRSSGEIMLSLINDLLDLSKIDAGGVLLEPSDFNVGTLIEDSLDLFTQNCRKKDVFLASMIDSDIDEYLHGDPTRIRQVLVNLVSNAVRFTDIGSVIVKAELCEKAGTEKSFVKISVLDTGIGISAEKQSQLFTPFTQLASDPKKKEGGTGLGLVIARKLVKLMGGEIGYRSRTCGGSEFWFTIPLQTAVFKHQPRARNNFENKSLLLVTEQHQISDFMREMLAMNGITVYCTAHPENITQGVYDNIQAIVLDSSFKGWRQVVEQYRRAQSADVPVLLLDFVAESVIDLEAMRLKVSAVPGLPLKQTVFLAYLNDLLGLSDGRTFAARENKRQMQFLGDPLARLTSINRVLVAEDNAINQRVVLSLLDRLGISADVVTDGREAVEAAKKYKYDAILMDCRMPVLDGFEATREIRLLSEHYRKVPIIAVTANASTEYIAKCNECSMNAHLAKPITIRALHNVLTDIVEEKSQDFLARMASKDEGRSNLHPFDRTVIESLRTVSNRLGHNLLQEITDLFLTQTPDLFTELGEALKQHRAADVSAIAHKIRGSARNVGATALAELCSQLESCADASKLWSAGTILTAMQEEFERARVFLSVESTNMIPDYNDSIAVSTRREKP